MSRRQTTRRKMDINKKNKTTGEDEMVGVELILEGDIKQEPIYHPEVQSDIPYFSVNNDPLDIKSEDLVLEEDVSNKEKLQDIDFFANNDPLNIKSEDVNVVVENTSSIVLKKKPIRDKMVGQIIDADFIKQENDSVHMGENAPTTSGCMTSDENIFDTPSGKHTCEICGLSFNFRSRLKKHSVCHKLPSEVCMYKCEKCAFESKHKSSIKSHTLNVHGNPLQLKKFSCKMCNYNTNYIFTFKKHMLVHFSPLATKKENKVYKCDSCEYTAKKKDKVDRHSVVHKSSSELIMHKCPLCPYQSKHPCGVPNHMLSHKTSSETPLFKCELCSYESKWRHCLRNHIKVHEKKSEYTTIRKCEACEFTTNNIYSLEIHMKSHTVRPEKLKETFTCYSCGFQARQKRQLVHHMLSHKPRWQVEMFECAVCGLQTNSKKTLRNHIMILHGPLANIKIKPNF